MTKGIEQLVAFYPNIPVLDLHYLSLKHAGVKDVNFRMGRPTWNLIDSQSLFHITFGTSELDSSYSIEDKILLHQGEPLPFRVDFVERVPVTTGRYFYFRNTDHMTPSLEDETILNVNFQRQCFSCAFCQFSLYKSQPNIPVEEGFKRIVAARGNEDLSDLTEIAIVTGCFGTAEKATAHIESVGRAAGNLGFKGRIFYMGSEITTSEYFERIQKMMGEFGMSGLRLAFTIEMFEDRHRLMNGQKPLKDVDEIVDTLRSIRKMGIEQLEYSYIPGMDSLEGFKFGAEKVSPYAKPPLCIFRPWKVGQRQQQATFDYLQKGPAYLCEMRTFLEKLHEGPVYGNNLANLWPFPLNRINPLWVNGVTVGENVGKRYWAGRVDPRVASVAKQPRDYNHFPPKP